MADAPRDRDIPASSPVGEPRPREEPGESIIRFGPLAISRHRKDDGRALILYTRRHDGEEDRGIEAEDRDQGAAAGRHP